MAAPAPTPIVVAWSGGKDSTLVLGALLADPAWRVVALVTTVTRALDRISIHGVRRGLLERQADALGLPLEIAWLDAPSSNAHYASAWADALARVEHAHGPVRHIAYGDLFLEDVRAWRDAQCAALGWTAVYPLWGRDTAALAREFLQTGHDAVLTCVDTEQLDAAFSGRHYDAALLADLPPDVDPCGERGEFHTFVWNAPIFAAPIAVQLGARARRDARFEYTDLLPLPS
jgi:uncharacterized protein (TIGR00290 family)